MRGTKITCVITVLFVLFAGVTKSVAVDSPVKRAGLPVRIEILPGVQEKWIDPVLAERVPVVVFGGPGFDVRQIDPATLVLAGAAVTKGDDATLGSYRDIDGDGITDLLVQFFSTRMRLAENGTRASLTGRTTDGRLLAGTGKMRAVESARAESRRALRLNEASEKLPPLRVSIDILSGDSSNRIELGNRGTLAVAVLSAPGFDATKLDPATLRLAGSPVTRRAGNGLASIEDVNGDALADLVVEVPKKLLRLDAEAREATLTGRTPEGRALVGSQPISLAATATLAFDSEDPRATPRPESVDFTNDAPITINDNAPAVPYPSTISVAGLSGVVAKVIVTLKNLTHAFPDDIDILLVGPTGQSVILMSDVGGNGPVSNVTLTFDDNDVTALDAFVAATTGIYHPTNAGAGDSFPVPAPVPMAATDLSAFDGTNPNGSWRLYVVDDSNSDVGTLGGWALDFVLASEFCTAGPITINDNVPATPYPATISVSGLTGLVSKVTGVFRGLSHSYPDDIDALLVAPTGTAMMMMSDVGGGGPPGVSGMTLVLDDDASLSLDPLVNPVAGTYRPLDEVPGDSLPAPAPGAPYEAAFSAFHGHNPNGTWNLYLADSATSDSGTLGRFCLDITTMTPVDLSNPASITIPAGAPGTTSGPASPYPSTIDVSGVTGRVGKVTVTLRGLTHTYPQDLDVLLAPPSPNYLDVLLMSDVGGGDPGVSGVTYTFDDDASASLPVGSNAGSGTYKPTNDDSAGADSLPAPALPGPHGSTLANMVTAEPNGPWTLHVFDDAGGDVGSISAGWSLTVSTDIRTRGICQLFPRISIPAGTPAVTQGVADPYPVEFEITDYFWNLDEARLTVTLLALSHGNPQDLDILLEGPQGQTVVLMSDAGGSAPGLTSVNLTLDDYGSAGIPQLTNPALGDYRPTDYEPGDVFPAPAPTGPYGTSMSVFGGTDPRGIWKLYIVDDAPGGAGEGSLGFCLNVSSAIDAAEVPNLQWANRTTLTWDAGRNARSYNLYRGIPGDLPALADPAVDSCLRGTTLTQQVSGLSENPAASGFFWYLVRGSNLQGEGSSGFARRSGGQVLARVENSAGACP